MMTTSLMFEQYLNPHMRKSQETFMKGFLLGNFSVRKCTQLTAHQPLLWILFEEISGLGDFCQAPVGAL